MTKEAETETGGGSTPLPKFDLAGRAFYFLVEDAGRELNARLLMAIQLSTRGAEVWIGQQLWFARNFAALKPGIALFKGMNMPQVANMRAARLAGHRTVVIDEELFGLVDNSGKRLHDNRVVRHCDLFLAQGNNQKNFLERDIGVSSDRIAVTGNPRVDLLRAPADAAIENVSRTLRETMGAFILVNTNFGAINPHDQDSYNYFRRCVSIQAVDPTDPISMRKFHDLCEFEARNLEAIAHFIAEIQDRAPDRKIVVRPHPAENPNSWRDAYADDDQVVIVEDNRHLAWIRAADALVHTSCTTGLEGYLLGARVIGLTPDPESEWSQKHLSNKVGEIHTEPKSAARALVGQRNAWSFETDAIRDHLHFQPGELASDNVVRALIGLSRTLPSTREASHREPSFQSFRASQRQLDQMSVTEPDLSRRLAALSEALGERQGNRIETIDANVFRISATTGSDT
jgi:surface carbohydrate biosynthesis protein